MGILRVKRGLLLLVLGAGVFFSASLYAAPAYVPGAISPAVFSPSAQVGIVAAVHGAVQIVSQGQVGKIVNSGQPVFLGDTISTDEKGSLQILLMDQTVFTIGPNSSIVINQFVYDPATDDGIVKAKVVKGIFRFVTGKIGQKKPQQMEVDLPAGTIGIRGTIVAGEVLEKKSLVVLLGPGEKNNTGHRGGKFTLSNDSGGQRHQETIAKTGFGSTIDGDGGAPSRPFQVPAEQLSRLTSSLAPLPAPEPQSQGNAASGNADADSASDGGEKSPTEQSGQGKAVAGESVGQLKAISGLVQNLTAQSNRASQDNMLNTSAVPDGITRALDLVKIVTGHFYYHAFAIPFKVDTANVYDFKLDIDFGSRTVGGGQSKLTAHTNQVDGGDLIQFALPSLPFPGSGNAVFVYNFAQSSDTGGSITSDANGTLTVALTNSGGQVGTAALNTFVVKDGTMPGDNGSGVASRVDGVAT